MGLAVLAGLSACRQPNPEWLGPADASASTTADDATDDGVESATSGASESGPLPDQCAPAIILGAGECPEACSTCENGRCRIDCSDGSCEEETVECPAGWPCDLVCTDNDSCREAEIVCPPDRDCTVECQAPNACRDASVTCGAGTCTLTCGSQKNVCDSLEVNCGGGGTTLTCEEPQNVDMDLAGSMCTCEAIGCED